MPLRILLASALLAFGSHRTLWPQSISPGPNGTIEIEQPLEWARGNAERGLRVQISRSTRVVGVARHPEGVDEVTLNGREMALERLTGGAVRFTGYLPITADLREAVVTATTSHGYHFSRAFHVEPLSAPPTASVEDAWAGASGGFKGRRWAVIIGISQYQDSRLRALRFADRDAKSLYDFLRSERAGLGGIPAENIQLLTNERATYRAIRTALFNFLKQATEDDVVYIYFAGHGTNDRDRRDNYYLVPYDADAANIAGTALPMEDVVTAIRKNYARHIIELIDACHSGGVGVGEDQRGLDQNQINQVFLEQMRSSSRVNVVFTASEANQPSIEGEAWGGGHGAFTYNVLQALMGEADENADHVVSLGEMLEWVRDNVRRQTRNAQIPTISQTSYDRSWPMSVVLPGSAVPAISEAEIAKSLRINDLAEKATDQRWQYPDSLLGVAGFPDTVSISMDSVSKEVVPGDLLAWASTDPGVAVVDSTGVVRPIAAGIARITAVGFGRRVAIPIRVLPAPAYVRFSPEDSVLSLTVGTEVRLSADLQFPSGQWLRGIALPVSSTRPLLLAPGLRPGVLKAVREGEAGISGRIAGHLATWRAEIRAAPIRIVAGRQLLALGDSLRLEAQTIDATGAPLGAAAGVLWRSSDTSTVAVRGNVVYGQRLGRAQILASRGTAEDSVTMFVLGDLLVGLEADGRHSIRSVSLRDGTSYELPRPLEDAWSPSLSPRGDEIAFVSGREGGARIFVAAADGSAPRRLTPKSRHGLHVPGLSRFRELSPVWSYDARRIFFVSDACGGYSVFSVASNGTDLREIASSAGMNLNVTTAPDLPRIAFQRSEGSSQTDVFTALPDGSEAMQLGRSYAQAGARPSFSRPQFLPGGKQMLVARTDAGQYRAGDILSLVDARSGARIRDLVPAQRDRTVVFSVSPDGRWVAYAQIPRGTIRATSIAVITLEGATVATFRAPPKQAFNSFSWAAVASRLGGKP